MFLQRLIDRYAASSRPVRSQVARKTRGRLRLEALEERRLLTTAPLLYTSTGGALTVDVSADHQSYEIRNAANAVVAQQLIANTSEIEIVGALGSANVLSLDFANASAQPTAVNYSNQSSSGGTITITSPGSVLPIAYTQFNSSTDEVIDYLPAAARSFIFSDDGSNSETISLAAGTASGSLSLQSTNAVPVVFGDPATSLTIDEAGVLADTINLSSLDSNFAGALTVVGGNETVNVAPTTFGGALTVNAGGGTTSKINLNASTISVTGDATLLAQSIVVNSSSVTTTGKQTYTGPVTLATTPITLTAGATSRITFNGSIDGASNLTVNAGTAQLFGSVGINTELDSLTVNAGQIVLPTLVETTGAKNYTEPTPSTLSGFAYIDANDNGTFDTGETPLSGVTITLSGTNDLNQAVSATATTAADGSYSFNSLRPGSYVLTETRLANNLLGLSVAGPGGSSSQNGTILIPSLVAGTTAVGNNFAELLPGSLAGYVYADANDNGTFDSGESGLSGVTITLTGTNDQGTAVSLTTTTAVNGAYTFSNLRPGTYKLTESRPAGYVDGADAIGSQGGTVAASALQNLVLNSGTNGVNNNFANLAPASLSGTVFVDANDNGAQDSGESGLSGVTITLSGTNLQGTAVSLTTSTSSTGAYTFNNLVPGTYTLTETQPTGYLAGTSTVGTQGGTTAGAGVISGVVVTLGLGGTGNNFAELKAASLSGFAYVDANSNGTFDTGETPLAGVTVTLAGVDDTNTALNLTAVTAVDGSYTFAGLRPGTYTLTETPPAGYSSGTDSIGSQASGTLGSATITAIALSPGINGTGNNFASLLVPPASQAVNLSTDYNLQGILSDGNPFSGGLDGVGNALSGTLLGASQVWNGVNFSIAPGSTGNSKLGPLASPNPTDNVVQATGQVIDLPAGQYTKLDFLATATNGNQLNQTFTVNYSDGTSTTYTQSISDWYTPQHYAGESIAVQTAYRDMYGGGKDNRAFDVYGYSITVDSSKTVTSITLPNDKHVELLAISTVNALTAPTGVTATADSSGSSNDVLVTWSAPATSGVTGYNIYRGTAAGGESTTPLNSSPLSASATSYDDLSVLPGNTYYYVVRALSGPATSGNSNEASAALAGSALTEIDLSSAFNVTGITADGAKFSGGIDGLGNALSGTLLGTSQTWNGVNFAIGAAGSNNVVQAAGQTIALPAGNYTQVEMLATGVNGAQPNQKFVINYSDGSSVTETISLSDWHVPQGYAGESVAISSAYRNLYGGGKDARAFDVYGYTITLPATAAPASGTPPTPVSITLPNDKNVDVLAMTAVGTLPAPTGLTATAAGASEVDLAWTAPSGAAVTGYDVYRFANGSTTPTLLTATPLPATATSYQDTTALPGNSYIYFVTPINGPATGPPASAQVSTPTSGTTTQVDLSSSFNLQGVTAAGAKFSGGGLDGVGNALSSTLVSGQTWAGGTTLNYGTATGSNVVQANGQTITLPAGQYSKVDLLATAVDGNQANQTFVVNYSDGTSTTITQSLSDWFTPQNYAGESTAITTVSRNMYGGGVDNRTFYVYSYTLNVDSSKTVTSITLPANKHVDVLAISTVQ